LRHRHGRVVGVNTLGGEDMALDRQTSGTAVALTAPTHPPWSRFILTPSWRRALPVGEVVLI
jgi:hypothetical protein